MKNAGFTMIEVLFAVLVISLLAAATGPQLITEVAIIRSKTTAGEIADIMASAQNYATDNAMAWPDQANNCVGAIATLLASGPLANIDATSPWQTTYATSCTSGTGGRFTVSVSTDIEWADTIAAHLPASATAGAAVTASVPHHTALPALSAYLPIDGSQAMTGPLDMGSNPINNVENVTLANTGQTLATGGHFRSILDHGQTVQIPTCVTGYTARAFCLIKRELTRSVLPVLGRDCRMNPIGGGLWRAEAYLITEAGLEDLTGLGVQLDVTVKCS